MGAAEEVMYPQKRGWPLKREWAKSRSAALPSSGAGSAPFFGRVRVALSASRMVAGDSAGLTRCCGSSAGDAVDELMAEGAEFFRLHG